MPDYASLQVLDNQDRETARDRLIYAVTAYMDAQGYINCRRESAERTVAFAPTEKGWAVFDDCADRLDVTALNGLGRCLSGKLRDRVVGVMCSGSELMLCLYGEGLVKDTYITSRRFSGQVPLSVWVLQPWSRISVALAAGGRPYHQGTGGYIHAGPAGGTGDLCPAPSGAWTG